MNDVPRYVLKQIRQLHGWSLNEWISFRWPPPPNGFTLLFLGIIFITAFSRLFIYEYDRLIEELISLSIEALIVDAALFKWFTDKRCMVALKKFRNGENWKNINPMEVSLGA